MIMHRVHRVILAAIACLPLFACETPPPGVVDAGAWSQALEDCRRIARLTIGYGNNFGAIGRPFQYYRNISSQIVDPCMVSRGFPPPPS
jgi:hypothetical protein